MTTRSHLARLGGALCAAATLATSASAQPAPVGTRDRGPGSSLGSVAAPPRFVDPDRLGRLATAFPAIDTLVRRFAERTHVPGLAYGIVVDGRLVHVRTAGYREAGGQDP